MTDYLIDQYAAEVEAALAAEQDALNSATEIYQRTRDAIIAARHDAMLTASIKLASGMAQRNRTYVEGPPPVSPEPATPALPPTSPSFSNSRGAPIDLPYEEEIHDDHED